MSDTKAADKIARVSDILEQIQALDEVLTFQRENAADASTIRQYEYMRQKFLTELNEIFRLFKLAIKPLDSAA
jgi:hypothetical protein